MRSLFTVNLLACISIYISIYMKSLFIVTSPGLYLYLYLYLYVAHIHGIYILLIYTCDMIHPHVTHYSSHEPMSIGRRVTHIVCV